MDSFQRGWSKSVTRIMWRLLWVSYFRISFTLFASVLNVQATDFIWFHFFLTRARKHANWRWYKSLLAGLWENEWNFQKYGFIQMDSDCPASSVISGGGERVWSPVLHFPRYKWIVFMSHTPSLWDVCNLFIYLFFASTMFLVRRSDAQTCAHADLLRSPPHVMWTLWVSLCGAPNQITSHVEEMNLRRAEREQRVICKRAPRCMCAWLHRVERGDRGLRLKNK